VYIANIVKHRPPDNRDPLPGEISACRPWIMMQLGLVKARMIVTLGRHSMAMFFPGKSISKIHGTYLKTDDRLYFAMYHPAAALHQQSLRRDIETDMLKIPALLAELTAERRSPAVEPRPEQLSLL
jgi:uracil-DNA glycosylase family 4